ncbi:sodium- and chloride-dependent glycine transporter 1 [Octopus bimaculoides]|uniref:sodium- and chloride-dependent glycine transporter 1 n=1 Tax=Octopus bimaculoides TaxID=37653 RepID=UPI0022E71A4D|nr:sodium- and chloride-dependent glycine transporter 1 [Octopus bimaculoides]
MTCVGYAVGLSNVWRFPYLCYKNGGGTFLIPYIIMLAIVGLPLFHLELAFGQFASQGPLSIWRINPLFKGVGFAMVIISWFIMLYYNVIISHSLYYFFASMKSEVPWASCNNSWNSDNCFLYDENRHNRNVSALYTSSLKTPSEEYYKHQLLQQKSTINEFGSPNWLLVLCLLLSWLLILVCLFKGIQSLGKIVYFTAIFPYFMLTVLLVRGVTLEGSLNGIIFFLKPDFKHLLKTNVWSDAATQIFFSLSTGTGGLITLSSFNKFKNNCLRDSILLTLINGATSIFVGCIVFSILGCISHEKGVPVSSVSGKGPGLVFEVYPEALARMPIAPIWSVCFFFMMALLGIGSQFSIVECVMSSILDELRTYINTIPRTICVRALIIAISFLLGLPMLCNGGMFLLNLIDFSISGFPLLLVTILECLAISYIYGFENFSDDIKMMLGKAPNLYWKISWKYLCPTSIITIAILNIVLYKEPDLNGKEYPCWAKVIGWLIVALPISVIPTWFLYKYCSQGGFYMLKLNMRPSPDWGPARKEDRIERYSADSLGIHKIQCLPESSSVNGLANAVQHASSLSTINSYVPNSVSGSMTSFNNAASSVTLPTANDINLNTKSNVVKSESIL